MMNNRSILKKPIHNVLIVFVLLVSHNKSVQAQTIEQATQYIEIRPDGTAYEAELSPETRDVFFYFLSKGNISVPLSFEVDGPDNSVVQVKSTAIKNHLKVENAFPLGRNWWNLKLRQPGSKKERSSFTIKSTAQALSSQPNFETSAALSNEEICYVFSDREMEEFLEQYSYYVGHPVTREEFCSENNPDPDPFNPSPTDPVSSSGLQATALIHKNSCENSDKAKYLVAIHLDLSKADPASLTQGSKARIQALSTPHRGGMKALLKPESEGRYSPRPIILMQSLSSFFGSGEQVSRVKWRRKKPTKAKKQGPQTSLYYSGTPYSLTLATGLTGGKAVYEIYNGSSAYSVCFKLLRVRQEYNGF
ncbi:MAG: hypothetical protein KDD42_03815 [Bdellovibrionales bacterium]|nr:hypothetical protein [Bdellovibrionales bacterium]